jgi:RNA polymerase sigma-70 factor (ECF subfamily)
MIVRSAATALQHGAFLSERAREDPSIEELVRRAQAGDEPAFDALVRRVFPRIHRWALAHMGDPDDAEEVTQRVLVQLHRHLAGYSGRAQFTTWLFRVTANAATNARAERWRRRRYADEARTDNVTAENPIANLHARRLAGLVAAYFQELPPRQRLIFDLADLQGLSTLEIAEMLRMKPVTVRANLFKARRTIRRRMLELHPELEEGYER